METVQIENKAENKEEVITLRDSVKILNDQIVQHDCVITGAKPKENISAVDAVVKLSAALGAVMRSESINNACFLKTVVVKFCSKQSKSKLMSISPKLKENIETKNVSMIICVDKQ